MKKIKSLIKPFLVVLCAVVIVVCVVKAGNLYPSASTAPTFYTLTDIYNRLNDNSTAGTHSLAPSGSPAGTFKTLTEIYNKIPTIVANTVKLGTTYLGIPGTLLPDSGTAAVGDVLSSKTFFGISQTDWNLKTGTMTNNGAGTTITPSTGDQTIAAGYWSSANTVSGDTDLTAVNIANGVTIFGVTGTLLKNMFNGTGQGITGGSQATGGVDDLNNYSTIPSDSYQCTWTQCVTGNNYCDTGLTSAQIKDECTGLIWSKYCVGLGCFFVPSSGPTTYSWDSSYANNSGKTASQLCSVGAHGESGWSLPHQKQLMVAYADGGRGNLSVGSFWSATTSSLSTDNAWNIDLGSGTTANIAKTTNSIAVFCVR